MAAKIRRDWSTSIDVRLMGYRQRRDIDGLNRWVEGRRQRRAWRRVLRRVIGR